MSSVRSVASAFAAAAMVLSVSASPAFANSHRPAQVPNGSSFSCGLCHTGGVGGNPRTPFGLDVEAMYLDPPAPSNGDVLWTLSGLALEDSDEDGFTNGEELCDPLGVWSVGDAPPGTGFSHPGDATATPSPGTCGDSTVDCVEECDGIEFGGLTCALLGFDGGDLACDACTVVTTGCAFFSCGDGAVNRAEEACDSDDLAGETCESLGFDGGTLACDGACAYDTSGCFACGDGVVNGIEECDGAALDGATCAGEGFVGGDLSCAGDCTLNTSACTTCGDDIVDAGEQCDGANLDGSACTDLGFDSGDLACDGTCQFDTAACVGTPDEVCGDGLRVGAEVCDGTQLGGQTCASQGFVSGALACDGTCQFDTSGCETCGDDTIDGDEVCDGTDLGGETCESQGFDGGTLACAACALDTSGCTTDTPVMCGDDVAEGDEECDGTDLLGEDCVSQGFDGGDLACSDTCTLDTTACTDPVEPMCGDGTINGDDACDGDDLGGETCDSQGFVSGTLACGSDCTLDTSGCSDDPGAMCGDGVAEGDEACDGDDLLGASCASQGFDGGTLSCSGTCGLDTSACTSSGADVGFDTGSDVGGAEGGDDTSGDEGCCSVAGASSARGRGSILLGALALVGLARRRRSRR